MSRYMNPRCPVASSTASATLPVLAYVNSTNLLARRGAGGACGRGGLGAFVARKDDGSERGDAANGRQQNAMMHIPSCGESGFNLIEWTMNFKSKLR